MSDDVLIARGMAYDPENVHLPDTDGSPLCGVTTGGRWVAIAEDETSKSLCQNCRIESDNHRVRMTTALRHTRPEDVDGLSEMVDDQLRPDGGSKYVRPTGSGYQGVQQAQDCRVRFRVAAIPVVDWADGDEIAVVEDLEGLGLVEQSRVNAEVVLGTASVTRPHMSGPSVLVPADLLRQLDGFEPDADVRIYEREPAGLVLVPADQDPRVGVQGVNGP